MTDAGRLVTELDTFDRAPGGAASWLRRRSRRQGAAGPLEPHPLAARRRRTARTPAIIGQPAR